MPNGRKLIVAAALVETMAGKVRRRAEGRVDAARAASWSAGAIVPPFDYYYKTLGRQRPGTLQGGGQQHVAWRVVPADFVTIDSGTGVVHQAPAFGEVDFDVLLAEQARFAHGEGPELICAVGARRQVHRRSARLSRAAGSKTRQGHHRASCSAAGCCFIRSSTCTTIRSAGGPTRIR